MNQSTISERDRLHLERALKVTPLASQTRSKAPGRVGPRGDPAVGSAYPLFLSRGKGAYVYVEDWFMGRHPQEYLDCAGANAAVPLGHAYEPVVSAVRLAVGDGSLLSLPADLEAFVCELFLDVCAPWAEQVRWVRTGSEATHAAYKIAKDARNRSTVLVGDWAYHGWHEWCTLDRNTRRVPTYSWGYDFNDLDHPDEIAAIFVEPHRWELPPSGWLQAVRAWCDAHGVLLVFDEMVFGLRWARGGSTEYYGVTPDLACFGKALGNGVPVACVCGRANVMAHTEAAGVSGTYGGELIGLSAAGAVLQAHKTDKTLIDKIWQSGQALWDGYHAVAPQLPLGGTPVHWRLVLDDSVMDRVLVLCAEAQLLVARAANNASAAMPVDVAWKAGRTIATCVVQAVNEAKAEVAHA